MEFIFLLAGIVLVAFILHAMFDIFGATKKDRSDGVQEAFTTSIDFRPQLVHDRQYRVKRIRQSGNEEDYGVMSGAEAITLVRRTFARSMAGGFYVREDTPDLLVVNRGYYHARGTQEGKKIRTVVVAAAQSTGD